MLKAFVELIASAIDTKSPYTGGHCQRVPELTCLLAEAAAKDKRYFAEFTMSSEQWEELTSRLGCTTVAKSPRQNSWLTKPLS